MGQLRFELLHIQLTLGMERHVYSSEFVRGLSLENVREILIGDTQFPITPQLLELVAEVYAGDAVLPGLMACPIGAPFLPEASIEWIAQFAERSGNRDLWEQAVSDPRIGLDRMLSAPPAQLTFHSLQGFVWKMALDTGRLLTSQEWQVLREACERAREQGVDAPKRLSDLL